jgi:hypothetical protein
MGLLWCQRNSPIGGSSFTKALIPCDAPPNSLMDSIASPKVKTSEAEEVGVRFLAHSTSGVEGHAGAPGWD